MRLNCVNSGSNANCYFLTNSAGEILILDCGVKLDRLMRDKGFTRFKNVAGALITHQHKDHSLSVPDLESAGVSVFGYMNLEPKKRYRIGRFDVIPFYVEHDVMNYGFIINEHGQKERFVYATDCAALPLIEGVDNWLIECNYTNEKWEENLINDDKKINYYGRVFQSHMGLGTLTDYFERVTKKAKNIILCHLSESGNADKSEMLERMSKYAERVDIATKNKEWIL